MKTSLGRLFIPVLICGFALASTSTAAEQRRAGIRVHSGAVVEVPEAIFFSFDNQSIPFRRNLHLTMVTPEKHPTPVVSRGPKGAFDELRAEFYGSVIRVDGKFRMWYIGYGFADLNVRTYEGVNANIGYAESEDGIHWTKPHLGLVEYHGDKANNLVAFEPEDYSRIHPDRNVQVFHDPTDPDPTRRYKMLLHSPMVLEGGKKSWGPMPLLSADGLRWRYALPVKMVKPPDSKLPRFDGSVMKVLPEGLECGTLTKLGGLYYINGQQGYLPDGTLTGRIMSTFWSSDFIHWNQEKALSFVRYGFDMATKPTAIGEGQEVHEGAALWNRGNVLVGIYGRWEGAKKWRDVRLNLGVVTSVNAIHFTEPDPNFVFAQAGAPGTWDAGGVLQGQGFENVGEQTYIWYGSWNPTVSGEVFDAAVNMLTSQGDVGLLKLRRDGFGYFSIIDPKKAKPHETFASGRGSLMTAAFTVNATGAVVSLNVDEVEKGGLTVQLLDEAGMPVPGYTAEDFIPLKRGGLRQEIAWKKHRSLPGGGTYRLRVGLDYREASPRLYAIYVTANASAGN